MAALGALLWVLSVRPSARQRVARFFLEPGPAENLALMRILIFGLLFWDGFDSPTVWYASLPEELISLPAGWEWLSGVVPLLSKHAALIHRLMLVACALATIGFFTRTCALVAATLAVFALGNFNFYFKVSHGYNVPVLCAFLLAFSRAGDAFSIDAIVRKWRTGWVPEPSSAYTVPVRLCWLIFGTMYLFPGIWKYWEGADLWTTGVKLQVEIFDKWGHDPTFRPLFRVDKHPFLMSVLGTATLVFEIGFCFALFFPRARFFAAAAATSFHLGVLLVMGIGFSLALPWMVLIDFPGVLDRFPFRYVAKPARRGWAWLMAKLPGIPLRKGVKPAESVEASEAEAAIPAPTRAPPQVTIWPPLLVGSALLASMVYAGIAPVNSWPMSVYPLFANRGHRVRHKGSSLEFALKRADGSIRDLGRIEFKPIGDTAAVFRIAREISSDEGGSRRRRANAARKELLLQLVVRIVRENVPDLGDATHLLIYSRPFLTDPDERFANPFERELVTETPLR